MIVMNIAMSIIMSIKSTVKSTIKNIIKNQKTEKDNTNTQENDRDVYRRGRVVERHDRKGIIFLEVDDQLIHLVHDTREILSIVTRH